MPESTSIQYVSFVVRPPRIQVFGHSENDWLSKNGIVWLYRHDEESQPYLEVRCPAEDEQKVREVFERYSKIQWSTELQLRTKKFKIFREVYGRLP